MHLWIFEHLLGSECVRGERSTPLMRFWREKLFTSWWVPEEVRNRVNTLLTLAVCLSFSFHSFSFISTFYPWPCHSKKWRQSSRRRVFWPGWVSPWHLSCTVYRTFLPRTNAKKHRLNKRNQERWAFLLFPNHLMEMNCERRVDLPPLGTPNCLTIKTKLIVSRRNARKPG